MAWLNLTGARLSRCHTCHGHVRGTWPRKAAHDGAHHLARVAATVSPEVIQAERTRRKGAISDE